MTTPRTILTLGLFGLVSLSVAPGCRGDREDQPPREFFPDMDNMPRWQVQGQSEFFADGRTMRRPVLGTVPAGRVTLRPDALASRPAWSAPFLEESAAFEQADGASATGKDAGGAYVASIPVPVTRELVVLGKKKFETTCAVCHGYLGDGQGMVAQYWSKPIPSFHDTKYKQVDPADKTSQRHLDGFLYFTSRHGVRGPQGEVNMPGYAHALTQRESWGVVAYIRSLQQSQEGTAGDLPEAVRQDIDAKRPRATAPAAPPAAAQPAAAQKGPSAITNPAADPNTRMGGKP